MDLRGIIQGYLGSDDRCQSFAVASLVQGDSRAEKILGLVHKNSDFGLLLFKNSPGITSPQSLQLESVYPIKGDFSVTRCSENILELCTDEKENLRFVFNQKSFQEALFFIQDLRNATANSSFSLIDLNPTFDWLNKYQARIQPQGGSISLLEEFDPWLQKPSNSVTEAAESMSVQPIPAPRKPKEENPQVSSRVVEDYIVFDMSHFGPTPSESRSVTTDEKVTATSVQEKESSVPIKPQTKQPPTFIARESYIKYQLESKEEQFTHRENFRIFVGTWNVNGQSPSESLRPWLCYAEGPDPDVIVVGFQELDLSAETLILRSDSSKEEEWLLQVEKNLPSSETYVKIQSVRLVGIMLAVYIKYKHNEHISELDTAEAATGIMGMFGNKGGVAIRFLLHNTRLCFINSHLAAHTEEYEKRNQDYHDIMNKLSFNKVDNFPFGVENHDIIFWLGDLNYRLSGLDTDKVKELAAKKQYEILFGYDQLKMQKTIGKCFEGFLEGPLQFAPTYKYDTGTDTWDSSEKCRCPSWCDRIQWRHGITDRIKQLYYTSHPMLKLSDHKPVSSLFQVGIKVVDKAKQKDIMETIVRQVDKMENEFLPQVEIDKKEFDFGEIHFLEKILLHFEIRNVGQVPVEYVFVPKLDETKVCADWLTVKPQSSSIKPDCKRKVELTVCVDKRTAAEYTRKKNKLEEILVLHLQGGRDLFLPISGTYIPSIFGSAIEYLCRSYGPIRDVPIATLVDLGFDSADGIVPERASIQESTPSGSESPSFVREPLEIPKELWLLVDHLQKHAMQQEDIFRQSGLESELLQIRDYLDTGQRGNLPGSNDSVAECLLMFLESVPEPVVPYAFCQKCLDCSNNYILCKQVVTQFPESHRNVFKYIMSFLRELLYYSEDNKLDPWILANIFGRILVRLPPSLAVSTSTSRKVSNQIAHKKSKFLWQFLVHDED